MVDPLSVATGVLTIIGAVKSAAIAAGNLHQASNELTNLIADLSELESSIDAIEQLSNAGGQLTTPTLGKLSNAQSLVVRLHQFLVQSMKGTRSGVITMRMNTAKYATRIKSYREEIKEEKMSLVLCSTMSSLSMQHQNREQMLDMGRAISGQTKLLQHIEQSTTSALDPTLNTHLMLANALRSNSHLIIDHPAGLRLIVTPGEYYTYKVFGIGPQRELLSFLCTAFYTDNNKRALDFGQLFVFALEGLSMLDTLLYQFVGCDWRSPPRFPRANGQNTVKADRPHIPCLACPERARFFRSYTSQFGLEVMLGARSMYMYFYHLQLEKYRRRAISRSLQPQEMEEIDSLTASADAITKLNDQYNKKTKVRRPMECRIA